MLLVNGAPVATASLTQRDLPARLDLKPWLAEVFVKPKFRRRGYGSQLVGCVEAACRTAEFQPSGYSPPRRPIYTPGSDGMQSESKSFTQQT